MRRFQNRKGTKKILEAIREKRQISTKDKLISCIEKGECSWKQAVVPITFYSFNKVPTVNITSTIIKSGW